MAKKYVYFFMAQGVITSDAVWVKAEVEFNPSTNMLADTKLHQRALVIVSNQGFFIKRPPKEIIGSTDRVFTDGLVWLSKNSKFYPEVVLNKISDKQTLANLNLDSVRAYISFLSANQPFEQPNFVSFLKQVLPKGLPSLI